MEVPHPRHFLVLIISYFMTKTIGASALYTMNANMCKQVQAREKPGRVFICHGSLDQMDESFS
jgi:hypothetical protein